MKGKPWPAVWKPGRQGKRILIPRSASGNPKLTEILEKAGARTEDIPTYETVYEPCQALDICREIDAGRLTV